MFPSISSIEIQKPNVQTEHEPESDFYFNSEARWCQELAEVRSNWYNLSVAAMEIAAEVDPYEPSLPVGSVIPAVEAASWVRKGVDIRPRLRDSATGQFRLIDTGAQITATCRGPNDVVSNTVKLVAVNGSKINTYGVRNIVVKINRKAYEIEAVVCDIDQDILGMDFLSKFKLGLVWDDFDQSELYIYDKKAQIKERLQIVTVPSDMQSLSYLGPDRSKEAGLVNFSDRNQAIAFQVSCMKQLGSKPENKTMDEGLAMHEEKYVKLLKKYPQLLNPSFVKGEPAHGVYHKIEVSGTPCRSKRRPISTNPKKLSWEKSMGKDGGRWYNRKSQSWVKYRLDLQPPPGSKGRGRGQALF